MMNSRIQPRRSISRRSLLGTSVLFIAALGSLAQGARANSIVGGREVGTCAWPSVVVGDQCSGVLVHPEVILTMSYCTDEDGYADFYFGESYTDSELGVLGDCYESDADPALSYCFLDRSVDDVPLVPIIQGCEVAGLDEQIGAPSFRAVGFGSTAVAASDQGIKREVALDYWGREDGNLWVGDENSTICYGDSGAPLFVRLVHRDGSDAGWRIVGLADRVRAGEKPCVGAGYFRPAWPLVAEIEALSGYDLSPCFDGQTGTWDPSRRCGELQTRPDRGVGRWPSCESGPVTGAIETCGPPRDTTAPSVRIDAPKDGAVVPTSGSSASVVVEVSASDDGSGVQYTTLFVDGMGQGSDSEPPYRWTVDLPLGSHLVQAKATDWADNHGQSMDLRVQVLFEGDGTGAETDATGPGTDSSAGTSTGGDASATGGSDSGWTTLGQTATAGGSGSGTGATTGMTDASGSGSATGTGGTATTASPGDDLTSTTDALDDDYLLNCNSTGRAAADGPRAWSAMLGLLGLGGPVRSIRSR